jgi:hypothetical protein
MNSLIEKGVFRFAVLPTVSAVALFRRFAKAALRPGRWLCFAKTPRLHRPSG